MNSWLIKLSQASFNFLPNEGNVFRNCIMVINNFWTVDGTGYLLLVMVEKGITIIINIKDWTLWPVPSPVTAARANASSVFQLFSFLVVCSVMISKGFGVVAFFVSEEASSFCIQPKTDLADNSHQPWVEWRPKPLHKTNNVIKVKVPLFAVCQHWLKLHIHYITMAHHDRCIRERAIALA